MSNIDHPKHYNMARAECIDIIEDLGLGFHLGNALKYIWRAGLKDPDRAREDISKARWYLDRYLEAHPDSQELLDPSKTVSDPNPVRTRLVRRENYERQLAKLAAQEQGNLHTVEPEHE